jgi:NAD-reducing hydrogenase small subunit
VDPVAVRKPRLATVWLGGCSGCHMSFLDLDERLLELAGLADLCYSPILDVKEFPEDVDLTLIEGAVANEDHLRELRLIRKRTGILIAFGDCAVTGNVTALRNLFTVDDALDRTYRHSTAVNGIPVGNGIVPRLLDRVVRIQDVVAVDHFLPGCPPAADTIFEFVSQLLAGHVPATEGRKFGA